MRSATLTQPDITGHAMFAVACAPGSSTFEVRATSATISGVLAVSINGAAGLATALQNPSLQLPGLTISASGIPQQVLDLIPIQQVIQLVAPTALQLFVTPLLNNALGTLTGPQKIPVLGQTLDLQVSPSAVAFDPSGGNVMLDMKLLIEGAEQTPGFLFTPNGMPALAPGKGLALGIADDLANEALAQLAAKGLLNLTLPGTTAQLTMTSPPMISADPTDGKLHVVLPDMLVMLGGSGQIAVNAQIALKLVPTADGSSLAIELDTPAIAIDTLDDGAQVSSHAVQSATENQRGSISDLLQSIPMPKVGGLTLTDTTVGGGNGYVLVTTTLK